MKNPDVYAKMLVGWFAIRAWDELATDRFDLRRRFRSGGGNPPWDINEPTKEDLRAAAAEIVNAVNGDFCGPPMSPVTNEGAGR